MFHAWLLNMSQADEIIIALEREFYTYYLIEQYTGKSIYEVQNGYSLPELIQLQGVINFYLFLWKCHKQAKVSL